MFICVDVRFRDTTVPATPHTAAGRGPFTIDPSSVRFDSASFSVEARITPPGSDRPGLNLMLQLHANDAFRVRITEDKQRWQPTDLLQPMPIVAYDTLKSGDARLPETVRSLPENAFIALTSKDKPGKNILVVHLSPLKIEMYHDGNLQIVANERNLLHYEYSRTRSEGQGRVLTDADRHQGKEVADYGEDGLAIYTDGTKEEKKEIISDASEHAQEEDWEEMFNGHADSKPRGPMSVGIDFAFPFAQNVYGIPEHTSPLSLPTTTIGSAGISPKYNEPYRLYNLDVFEYELDNTMALYGHIPFMSAHGLVGGVGQSAGVFWFNPSETFVDVSDSNEIAGAKARNTFKDTHWISESGHVDFFLFPGPSPKEVFSQFTGIVGRQQLPPLFALGYHQCRWNYRDEKDVAAVEGMFEQLDYPMDVIWLDIEHTDGKRYFTWDKHVFPNPLEMQKNVSAHGRKMVTIVDPHIKRDSGWSIHKEATEKGLYIKNKDGADFDGWCWPGSSSYLDFTDPNVRSWWAQQFALDKYIGSTMDLFTWNDMNEPSVFNGPEVSMSKDAKNLAGVEHREWHNLYGLYMQQATAMGLEQRKEMKQDWMDWNPQSPTENSRPFVLSRAFWAGSQRFGAIWTGDNTAQWGHLKIASPMLLSINLAGLSFAGSDIGGFFGEPGAELFTRWYQAGAFTPFFRGHAHHDTKRREPWSYGEPYTTIHRTTAIMRYTLLPYWYSTFYEAYTAGIPVMRTMFTEFPSDPSTFSIDDQWMVGSALLVKPVTESGATSVQVYLPIALEKGIRQTWYDFHTLQRVETTSAQYIASAPLDKIPVFLRGGRIIPRKLRLRRSSKLMYYDPYTLVIAYDGDLNAEGMLYLDDEYSMEHQNNPSEASAVREFTMIGGSKLTCRGKGSYRSPNSLERVIIAGQPKAPSKIVVKHGEHEDELQFYYDSANHILSIKKPDVLMTSDWDIYLLY